MSRQSFHFPVLSVCVSLVILLTSAFLIPRASAAGTTRYVAPGGGCGGMTPCYASIQAAVDAAGSSDEIKIAASTYTGINTQGGLAQMVYINKSITLRGGYTTSNWTTADPAANLTTLDAEDSGRVIAVFGSVDVTITGLRLVSGDATGLYGMDTSNHYGGGMYVQEADVTVDQCTISDSIASQEFLYSGYGGGYFQWGGSLTLSNSILSNNIASDIYYGYGGGISLIETVEATLTGNHIQDNTACSRPDQRYGYGGGIHIEDGNAELTGNTITGNTGAVGNGSTSYGHGGGVYIWNSDVTINGNTVSNNVASVQRDGYGGGLEIDKGTVSLLGNTINNNVATSATSASYDGTGGGIKVWDCDLTLTGNTITGNSAADDMGVGIGGGVYIWDGTAAINENVVFGNHASADGDGTGGGLYIRDLAFTMDNNVVAGNDASQAGGGMYIMGSLGYTTDGDLIHNTFAANTGSDDAVCIENPNPATTIDMTLDFINSIVVDHDGTGVLNLDDDPIITMDSTLWFDNGTDYSGDNITATNDYAGDPAFVAPLTGDFHIVESSAALDKGASTSVLNDIDDQSRPNGSAPDLGADEYYPETPSTYAEKAAFEPQWVQLKDGVGDVMNILRQRYLLQFRHSDGPGYITTLVDTLPDTFSYISELHSPAMTFDQAGDTLTWQTGQMLPPGQVAQVLLTTHSEAVEPFDDIVNTADIDAGSYHFDLEASSEVPIFPPLVTKPGNGEICPGNLDVEGVAFPNTIVEIYEGIVKKATTTADGTGAFSVSYASTAGGLGDVSLTAVSCLQSAPDQCSAPSTAITLEPPITFICPQRSTLENTPTSGPLAGQTLVYPFVDQDGWFTGDTFEFNLVPPHINSSAHIYRRSCEEMGAPAGSDEGLWMDVLRDDTVIATYNPSSVDLPWYHFSIDMDLADDSLEVEFKLSCTWVEGAQREVLTYISRGDFATSLMGSVFDVTQGPGEGDLAGVSVAAMSYQEDSGGWVPWPGHLYDDQENPQVTDENGEFIFFVPPGSYYLVVDGGTGYHSWRSRIIDVGAEPLSIDIPLTPTTLSADHTILMQASGPDPAVVNGEVGDTVEWIVEVDAALSIEEQMALVDEPILRAISLGSHDPLMSVLGFDSGYMIPGNRYIRTFNTAGTYTYSDSADHTGTITIAEQDFTITATAGAHGSIIPSGAVTVAKGEAQGFTITPHQGYQIADVLVDGSSVGPVSTYTFTNVSADHTISATFKADAYQLFLPLISK